MKLDKDENSPVRQLFSPSKKPIKRSKSKRKSTPRTIKSSSKNPKIGRYFQNKNALKIFTDIGGADVFAKLEGVGSPPVVFISGCTDTHEVWNQV